MRSERVSSERWQEKMHMKERCQESKSLLSFREVFGKEKKECQTVKYDMDEIDMETIK